MTEVPPELVCTGCATTLCDLSFNGVSAGRVFDPLALGTGTLTFRVTDTHTGRFLDFTLTKAIALDTDGTCEPNADASGCIEAVPCKALLVLRFDVDGARLIDFPDLLALTFSNPCGSGTITQPIGPGADADGAEVPHNEFALWFDDANMEGSACGGASGCASSVATLQPNGGAQFTVTTSQPDALTLKLTCGPCVCEDGGE